MPTQKRSTKQIRDAAILQFAEAILHGDDEHRGWLMAAAVAFNAGKPLPPPAGKGTQTAVLK